MIVLNLIFFFFLTEIQILRFCRFKRCLQGVFSLYTDTFLFHSLFFRLSIALLRRAVSVWKMSNLYTLSFKGNSEQTIFKARREILRLKYVSHYNEICFPIRQRRSGLLIYLKIVPDHIVEMERWGKVAAQNTKIYFPGLQFLNFTVQKT